MEDEGLDSDADAQDSDGMTVDDDSDDGDDEDLGNHLRAIESFIEEAFTK